MNMEQNQTRSQNRLPAHCVIVKIIILIILIIILIVIIEIRIILILMRKILNADISKKFVDRSSITHSKM
jgi:hypothetical protein